MYLSNDDKARIGIGVTAANKQASMLMNVEYKVRLLDHDFVIAPRHKLIPSVYSVCDISPKDGSMTYSGNSQSFIMTFFLLFYLKITSLTLIKDQQSKKPNFSTPTFFK